MDTDRLAAIKAQRPHFRLRVDGVEQRGTGLESLTTEDLDWLIGERERWGEQNYDPETWLAILVQEVGELATAALQERFGQYMYRYLENMRTEAVHVVAVAVAMIEWIDRQQK